MARASTALDSYVAELGNDISYDKRYISHSPSLDPRLTSSLSSSRFLKTILARHSYGPLVLKIFIKPDAAMSLRVIQRRLKSELPHISCGHSSFSSGERLFGGSAKRKYVSDIRGDRKGGLLDTAMGRLEPV